MTSRQGQWNDALQTRDLRVVPTLQSTSSERFECYRFWYSLVMARWKPLMA
jgi:hypothetical protein